MPHVRGNLGSNLTTQKLEMCYIQERSSIVLVHNLAKKIKFNRHLRYLFLHSIIPYLYHTVYSMVPYVLCSVAERHVFMPIQIRSDFLF